jgi:hypothetical protein
MSSVDYGKFKENKIKGILGRHYMMVDETAVGGCAQDDSIKDTAKSATLENHLLKIQKLFNFYSQNEDADLKAIIKEEIERLLRDALNTTQASSRDQINYSDGAMQDV